jgi:hypothetical protein
MMTTLLALLPKLLNAFLVATKLKGSLSSKTTQGQLKILGPVALIVVIVGIFVPDVVPYQNELTLSLCSILGAIPFVRRYFGYVEPSPTDTGVPPIVLETRIKLADTFMTYVFHADGSWRPFVGTGLDALHLGYEFACDSENWIWELTSATKTDKQRPVLRGTPEQSNASMKLAIAAIKARLAEIRAQKES